jgi:hypothetical protein
MGFDNTLIDMKVNEEKEFAISPETSPTYLTDSVETGGRVASLLLVQSGDTDNVKPQRGRNCDTA